MSDTRGEPRYEFVLAPDNPDTRLFVELCGYANADILPAREALDVALDVRRGDRAAEAEWLVDFAVVSYCRAFLHSKVRGTLDEHISIPANRSETHETIRAYRNTTVAHSQSDLRTTWPVVIVDHGETPRRTLMPMTIGQPLPWALVTEFLGLVNDVLDLVRHVIDGLYLQVDAHVQRGPRLLDLPPGSGIARAAHTEFNARTKRGRFPTRQTLYWSEG